MSTNVALRYNWQLNCWQVWSYLNHFTRRWRWFCITPEEAKKYMDAKVPVIIEETVS